ncbi:MAG: hypothetical protein AABX44_00180 [Nanoarchaeota archaeon]
MPKKFKEYIEEGIIKKIISDKEKAKFLIAESEKSLRGLNKRIKLMGIDEENTNSIIKDIYDIIMELVRAKLLIEGYKSSGQFSHEAEVSFLIELGFSDNEVLFLNQLRYSRNSIIYYGKILNKEYAKKAYGFLNKIYPKLSRII